MRCWKVVNQTLYGPRQWNSVGASGWWQIVYELGEWSTGLVGTGLFAFRTLGNARAFARRYPTRCLRVLRCWGAGRVRRPAINAPGLYWFHAWRYLPVPEAISLWPPGTICFRAVYVERVVQ